MEKLVAAGVMKATELPPEDVGVEDMVVGDVELNIDEPRFLKGEVKEIFDGEPLKVNNQPEGHMQRSAMMAIQLAKARRERKKGVTTCNTKTISKNKQYQKEQEDFNPKQIKENQENIQICKDGDKREWSKDQNDQQPKTVMDKRKELPIFGYRENLMATIKNNQIVIIIGETGCGKTTQITQYLDEDNYTKNGRVGCTQPRRVATISVAQRVAYEMNVRVGRDVGYAIRFEDKTSAATRIKYMTDGMLLREYLVDPDLPQYSVLILDEAHERTVGTDILFGLLKQTAQRRPDFKLIVTSATLEAEKFSKYFNNAPVMHIPGRTFEVEKLYLKEPEMDYIQSAVETVMKIHLTQPPGDILLFLTGQEEIDTTCSILKKKVESIGKDFPALIPLPIYASLPTEQQKEIFEPPPPFARKCVVATNIAETSITIDGIYYVVDSGFVKQNIYNPRLGMDQLLVTPISQACSDQRAGRAGRTGPGQCYRLYTEKAFENEMPKATVPEIQRANLATTSLLLKAIGISDVANFDYMDPPPHAALVSALHHLYAIGALDDNGSLTRLGRRMAEFPLEPPLAKMLIAAEQLGCTEEAVTVVAALSVGNFFSRPKERAEEADRRRRQLSNHSGDHLTLLTTYRAWVKNGKSVDWCRNNYLNSRSLHRCQDVRDQLMTIMKRYGIQMISSGNEMTPVLKAIVSGFFVHAAKRDPQEGYRTVVDGQQVFIHPTSALFGRTPEWVVYHELVLTTKEYMRETIAIDPKWLIELAPAFYQVSDGSKFNARMKKGKLKPLFDRFNKDQDAWKVSNRYRNMID
ncbi:RNA helicase [Entamoeba marina]